MADGITTKIVECIPSDSARDVVPENVELDIYSSPDIFKFKSRGRRRSKTNATKWFRNRRESLKRLRRIIKTYFAKRDYYITLTYREAPRSLGAVYKDGEALTEGLVRRCRKMGIKVYWLYVVERGRKNGRYHLHLLINKEVPVGLVYALWGKRHGDVFVGRTPSTAKRIHRLSSYSVKGETYETHKRGRHGWRSSKNIKDPKIEKDNKLVTRAEFAKMVNGDGKVDEEAVRTVIGKKFPGYRVVYARASLNPYMCVPYLSVMLQTVELAGLAELEERELKQEGERLDKSADSYLEPCDKLAV